jgi:tRNA dimethylallyltransferase
VKKMMEDGREEESRGLWASGRLGPQAREGLGYKQLIEHFEGRCSLEDAVEEIKIETRRFAKNQRTWLRRLRVTQGSVWIDAAAVPVEQWSSIVLGACR